MQYIMKVYKISPDVNEYIVFNTSDRTKSKLIESESKANELAYLLDLKWISKIRAVAYGYLSYKRSKNINLSNL